MNDAPYMAFTHSGSLVGLKSCSVDVEAAFDSREVDDPDSEDDPNSDSYEAQIQFTAGIEAVHVPMYVCFVLIRLKKH